MDITGELSRSNDEVWRARQAAGFWCNTKVRVRGLVQKASGHKGKHSIAFMLRLNGCKLNGFTVSKSRITKANAA